MHITEFLKDYVKTHPFTVFTNLSFTLLVPIQDVVLPHYYGKLIDSISSHKDLKKYIIYVLVIFIGLEIGFILSDWHDINTISGFQTFTRREILLNLMAKYEKNFSDLYLGTLMSKMVKIPYTLVVFYERLKYVFIPFVLVVILAAAYFSMYDSVLALSMIITAVIYVFIIFAIPQMFCKTHATEKDKMVNEIHEEIDDMLRNFIAIHGDADKQLGEVKRLEKYEELFTVRFADTMKCLMKTKIYTSASVVGFTGIFIYRSYHLLKKGTINAASFSSMFLILVYLTHMMMNMESTLRETIFDTGIIAESDELFEKDRTSSEQPMHKPVHTKHDVNGAMVSMRNVSFAYPNSNDDILKDISFDIKKGDTIVILGDIGCGKSTILKMLLKFNEPKSGQIYIDGISYDDMTVKDIKQKVGYVPQQPILFNRSVIENVMYGAGPEVSRQSVEDLMKKTGAYQEFVNLDDGLDTKIGKNGSRLSGGQRQVVWCLRTLVQNPDIIVMDEPTASLDEKSKDTLKMILDVMMGDKTVIIVTHDKDLLASADRQLVVKDGMIEERGGSGGRDSVTIKQDYFMTGGLLDV